MILLAEIEAIWKHIRVPNVGEKVDAHTLKVDLPTGNPLLTVDDTGYRHLLISIPDSLEVQNDTNSGGIHVVKERWGIHNSTKSFIDIYCLKPHLNDLFNLVILEIFDEIIETGISPDRAAHAVLTHWRELILNVSSSLPSQEKLIGIVGELWFLRELTKIDDRAIEIWQGPLGKRFDFYTGLTAVEVKTSKRTSRKTAVIHGHMQLVPPPNAELYLLHIQIEYAAAAQTSIRALINDIVELGCNERRLYKLLLNLNVSSEVISDPNLSPINILGVNLYRVDPLFPKITDASFVDGKMPAGVLDLQYEIDLQNVEPISHDSYEQFIRKFVGELNNAVLS